MGRAESMETINVALFRAPKSASNVIVWLTGWAGPLEKTSF